VEKVDTFRYLGRVMHFKNDDTVDVKARIGAGKRVFHQLKKQLREGPHSTIATRVKIYHTVLQAIALYGCESWTLTESDCRLLRSFEQQCLRYCTNLLPTVTPATTDTPAHVTMPSAKLVLQTAKTDDIVTLMNRRRLRFYGHVLRMPDTNLVKQMTLLTSRKGATTQRRGHRTASTWPGQMEALAATHDLTPAMAQDRALWRAGVQRKPHHPADDSDDSDSSTLGPSGLS
jgi:hypothetical protein